MNKARKAYNELTKRYNDSNVVKSVGRSVERDKTIDRYSQPDLRVYVDDIDSSRPSILDKLHDITIRKLRHKEGQLDCEEDYHRTTDPLEGALAGGGSESGCPDSATWACRLKDQDTSEHYMLHCAHTFDLCSGGGKGAWNMCNVVGKVNKYSLSRDVAIVQQTDNMDVSGYDNWIANEVWGPISGHVTQDGVDELIPTEETVYKRGKRTCLTEGIIHELTNGSTSCAQDNYNYVRISNNHEPGDSGGPYYVRRTTPSGERYLAMVGIHHGSDGWGGSKGCSAFEIHDWSGLTFS